MKQKIGTAIEADVPCRDKRQAADEERPLSDLIQDALDRYLTAKMPAPDRRREAACRSFCGQPMRVSPEQFRQMILHADAWDL